jgi:hypothetical protein
MHALSVYAICVIFFEGAPGSGFGYEGAPGSGFGYGNSTKTFPVVHQTVSQSLIAFGKGLNCLGSWA